MIEPLRVDLGQLARDVNLPANKVERTVALLEDGNTVPFITRYRKDETGGLDEEQIRAIQDGFQKMKMLVERKTTILKSIESQGKLTPELAEQIRSAHTPKRLEDLYLPFKPRKQTLATVARERGLEPLAKEILEADPAAVDLDKRATDFVSADKQLSSIGDVLLGVGHLLAEKFGENPELRGRLRRIFQRTGKLVCTKIEAPPPGTPATEVAATGEIAAENLGEGSSEAQAAEAPVETTEVSSLPAATPAPAEPATPVVTATASLQQPPPGGDMPVDPAIAPAAVEETSPTATPVAAEVVASSEQAVASGEALPAGRLFEKPAMPIVAPSLKTEKKKKKKKKKVVTEQAFKDFYDYSEPISKIPPHRILAINRGERARAIRVKLEADVEAMATEAETFLVPADHPHAVFLKGCVRDALQRLILPSLEREARREQTDHAEEHAVDVFIRNLRKLLLQPPTHGRRVLAVDPGFKSGCKLVALDEFGNVLGHSMMYVIGKDERHEKARTRLADMVKQYNVSVIAIGNGTGCRETEQLVADVLSSELAGRDVAYAVVNEAGASIYSTSPLGREELPHFDALQRGAISIGRRLLDPLSEMVKINPANLGVGLYQHDMKARHLKDSLDAVVESCVNFVGVDVNSASPALLRYVSGMNALTARRVYEYRREHGPFKNREQLKNVPGFGEATFVQSAGFLKIIGGENPLDATWIHPESYTIARSVLEKMGTDETELAKIVPAPPPKPVKSEFGALPEEKPAEPTPTPAPVQVIDPAAVAAEGAVETAGSPPATEAPAAPAVSETPTSSLATPETLTPIAPSQEQPSAGSAAEALSPQPVKNRIAELAAQIVVEQIAAELAIGVHLLQDILNSFKRPGLDPRDTFPPPLFRRGITKLEDLQSGMELQATVLNVVDFGVFVDIGLSDSGLIHISRLADRYIRDPHEVVGVGDVLKVWVVEVDKNRRRVSLTAIAPGSEKPQRPPRERGPRRPRQEGAPGPGRGPQPVGAGAPGGDRPPRADRPAGDRPPRDDRRDRPRGDRPPGDRQGPPRGDRPPMGDRPQGQRSGPPRGRGNDRRRDEPPQPRIIERPPTKPKVDKPLTKAQQDGRAPMRSFGDLQQFFEKKKPDKDDSK
ncbi:Tex-like N-terminal domain-containing protein [Anatilimnocola floriformis]|uniref:Tex-like N-terminal domain-containing protein n=1 Tax=Anatilimnocola floriformis TaxID=2948575 RepID=UPI0020C5ABF9|nr:Tex-like N-terminal domain-containing protein [Anatilimnocola floriformis]